MPISLHITAKKVEREGRVARVLHDATRGVTRRDGDTVWEATRNRDGVGYVHRELGLPSRKNRRRLVTTEEVEREGAVPRARNDAAGWRTWSDGDAVRKRARDGDVVRDVGGELRCPRRQGGGGVVALDAVCTSQISMFDGKKIQPTERERPRRWRQRRG